MNHTLVLKLIKSEPLARFALAVPALGTMLGSVLMALGGFLPCLVMDAIGLLLGFVILLVLVLKYLWIEHLLLDGDEIEGRVTRLKDNEGLPLTQTTEVHYEYSYDGVDYKRRIVVHLPESEILEKATIVVDPDRPEASIIKELYCVSA